MQLIKGDYMKRIDKIKLHRKIIRTLFETYNPGKKIPIWVYLHDLDKLIMIKLGVQPKLASKIHRKFAFHHAENIFGIINGIEMIYDWESARFSKPDKQLNAIETCEMFYPGLKQKLLPLIHFELIH